MQREVICQDALDWLERAGTLEGCSLVTSLPDFSEFTGWTLVDWKTWFVAAAHRVLACCPQQGMCIFYQSDIREQGVWVDKAYLVQAAAEKLAIPLLWHKIACRVPAGSNLHSRAGYGHLLCFSPQLRPGPERAYADVLPRVGPSNWNRGLGLEVCRFIVRQVKQHTPSHTLVAPFCGQGLILAVANQSGLRAVGIERSRKRARAALAAQLPTEPQG